MRATADDAPERRRAARAQIVHLQTLCAELDQAIIAAAMAGAPSTEVLTALQHVKQKCAQLRAEIDQLIFATKERRVLPRSKG